MSRAVTHFFSPDGAGAFHPSESALSRWGNDSLNGPAEAWSATSESTESCRPG